MYLCMEKKREGSFKNLPLLFNYNYLASGEVIVTSIWFF